MRRPIRPWLRVPRRRRPAAARPKGGILLPVLIGIGLAVAVIVLIDAALRPTVTELAKAKVKNAVTSIINDAVNETLSSEAISYGDLVTLGEGHRWAGDSVGRQYSPVERTSHGDLGPDIGAGGTA